MPSECPSCGSPLAPGKEGDVDLRCTNPRSCPAQLSQRLKYLASRGAFDIEVLGWEGVARIWAGALVVMAILFFVTTKDEPDLAERRARGVAAACITGD